jgi:predicted phage terminase large subunit-like protein
MEKIKAGSEPQRQFLSTSADIAIYGGSAGGGKTYGLLIDPVRHVQRVLSAPFCGAIFRKQSTQVTNPGGLWDASMRLYPLLGARPNLTSLRWTFPSGATLRFAHLDFETDTLDWQGTELAFIGFDELTHFSEAQFFYMLSRNRSMCGIRPYVRATCNPDPDSFVAKLIEWWIDQDTGLAIAERSGIVRWFIRVNGEMIWADSRQELVTTYGPETEPKSLTFIRGSVYDNKVFLAKDPGYLANLKALPRVDRERLLGGNWKVRPAAGDYFKREWFSVVPSSPPGQTIRYWDRAATEKPTESNPDPDWTAGVKLTKSKEGVYYVMDVRRFRANPTDVKMRIRNMAEQDGREVKVGIEQDPGQAGISEAQDQVRNLAGFQASVFPVTKKKGVRAGPVSSQCGIGNVKLVAGSWNDCFLDELANFDPDSEEGTKGHDDQVDALSGAFNALAAARRIMMV